MDKLKIALLALVAGLLIVQLIDREREPAQIGELKKSIDALNATLARGVVAAPTAPTSPDKTSTSRNTEQIVTWPVAVAPRNGQPVLGENFLLPYDGSTYHQDWSGGTLRLISETPKGFNPLIDNSSTSASAHGLCNDSLCERRPQNPEQWSESLATAVVISDNWQTYTFTLRDGVLWQRPALASQPEFAWLAKDVPLTAEDFTFALDLIMDPAVDCTHLRNYYEDLESWEAVDAKTLRLHWKRKVYTSLTFSLGLTPLPRHIYGASRDGVLVDKVKQGVAFNKHWFDEQRSIVGVGAYQLEVFEPDERMVFRRNPQYWGTPLHFETIEWNLRLKQPEAELTAFKNGQVHSDGLSPLQYKAQILDGKEPRFAAFDAADPQAGRRGEFGWERVKGLSFSYLGWNLRRPPFNDRRVRQAMSHAFPKERIIRDVFLGLGQGVLSDVHPDSQYYNADLQPYVFDLARARALLAEAGWIDSDGDGLLDRETDGKREVFAFEVKYYANSPEWDNTLSIYRNELRTIGIELTPRSYEWKELIRIYEDHDFAAVVGGWGMDLDIDYFQLWHSSQVDVQGSSNHIGFANREVDALADELRTTFEVPQRIVIAKRIQAILHEEQPYTFFKSGVGIFTWQNHPAAGAAGEPGRYLAGVITGLDSYPPLVNRAKTFWRLRE